MTIFLLPIKVLAPVALFGSLTAVTAGRQAHCRPTMQSKVVVFLLLLLLIFYTVAGYTVLSVLLW